MALLSFTSFQYPTSSRRLDANYTEYCIYKNDVLTPFWLNFSECKSNYSFTPYKNQKNYLKKEIRQKAEGKRRNLQTSRKLTDEERVDKLLDFIAEMAVNQV